MGCVGEIQRMWDGELRFGGWGAEIFGRGPRAALHVVGSGTPQPHRRTQGILRHRSARQQDAGQFGAQNNPKTGRRA
eukprot:343345-Chlamydomonas_euryale.AAC.1